MARLTCCYDWRLQDNAVVIRKCHFAYYSQYSTRQEMATLWRVYTCYYMIFFAECILHIISEQFWAKNPEGLFSLIVVQISILMKESLSMRSANKLSLFAGVYTTPLQLGSFCRIRSIYTCHLLAVQLKVPSWEIHVMPRASKSAYLTPYLHAAPICNRI